MAQLKITLKAEHFEDDRRHLDSELAKFRAVLQRAGYETECEVDFEVHADLKKEARSLQQAKVRRRNRGPVSKVEAPDADLGIEVEPEPDTKVDTKAEPEPKAKKTKAPAKKTRAKAKK